MHYCVCITVCADARQKSCILKRNSTVSRRRNRRATLFSRSPCFLFLPVSYTAVALDYRGHQFADRRQKQPVWVLSLASISLQSVQNPRARWDPVRGLRDSNAV